MQRSEYEHAIFAMSFTGAYFENLLLNTLMRGGYHWTPCVGRWKGDVEKSWLVSRKALEYLMSDPVGKQLIANEEAFLLVSGCNKQYAALWYTKDNRIEPVGNMHNVGKNKPSGDYTYRCDTGNYHVVRKGNPDKTPPPAGHPSAALRAQIQRWYIDLTATEGDVLVPATTAREVAAYVQHQFGLQIVTEVTPNGVTLDAIRIITLPSSRREPT